MRAQKFYTKLIFAAICIGFLSSVPVTAQTSVVKSTQIISLGDTSVKINIYEKKGANLTFFVPHHNEQTGLGIAKEMIAANGGRLVEIESLDEKGNPLRQVRFSLDGKSYSVDPNRIYTENGRQCANVPAEVSPIVKNFADSLLKILFAPGAGKLRDGEKFLVAVHNNSDVDEEGKSESARERDLTAYAYLRQWKASKASSGPFHEQVEGVYLSNAEDDEDNFFFVSTPVFVGFLAEKGFNVALQKNAVKLQSKNCGIDDGSLSVYSGQLNLPYINVEADLKNGSLRQRQMLEAVYDLLRQTNR